MKTIPLTQGKFALVDDEDYEELSKHRWCAQKAPRNFYAVRRVPSGVKKPKQRTVRMHMAIAGTQQGMVTDHINGDGLDNRRCNLRVVTSGQNMYNLTRKSETTVSRFRGVRWSHDHNKWRVDINRIGGRRFVGYFASEIEAAGAYDVAGIERDGEHFTPNFSASWLAPRWKHP